MNDLTHAVEIAVSVRNYLREHVELHPKNSKEIQENHEKISRQLKNISRLKGK